MFGKERFSESILASEGSVKGQPLYYISYYIIIIDSFLLHLMNVYREAIELLCIAETMNLSSEV